MGEYRMRKLDMYRQRRGLRGRRLASLCAIGVIAPLAAACTGGTSIGQETVQNSKAPIVVWTDSTRLPGFQEFQKTHPDIKMKIVTYNGDAAGSNYLQSKVELYNRTGHGWPDVVFTELQTDVAWAADPQYHFAQPLDQGLVPTSTIGKFATGTLDVCKVQGKLYCLRNDVAQDVLWYNKPLLEKFGYSVPTTWEQYKQLGLKVAKEHPGYIIGTVGDSYSADVYYWPSQCPANHLVGTTKLEVNLHDPHCTRVTQMLDPLVSSGAVAKDAALTPGFAQKYGKKVLMVIGPSWYGEYLFHEALKTPKGQIAAAAPLRWSSDSKAWTGDVGGGIYMVSRHSANLKAATEVAQWMATSDAYQDDAPTYPAYAPAAKNWLKNANANGYFATDPSPAFTTAAGLIWPGWSALEFSPDAVWASTVVPAITSGDSLSSVVDDWQSALENHAKAAGYSVTPG